MDPVATLVGVDGFYESLADRWFQMLDQRQIDVGNRRRTARVIGIHTEGNEVWIQLATGRGQDRNLVLHLSSWTTVDQVVAAMKTKPLERGSYPQIVTLIPIV